MDPLTALGLAANIAQFIDFGVKLVSESKEIAEAGSSVTVAHLSAITSDLVDINENLKNQQKPNAFQNTPEEEALGDLADQCNEVAQQLIQLLEKVTLRSEKYKRWQSVRAALQEYWNKHRFDEIASRLAGYRQQLSLRLLVLLNSHQSLHDERADKYKNEIIEVVSINCRGLRRTIEGQQHGEKERQERERVAAEKRHEETLMAILTTRDGNSTAITAPKYSADDMSALKPGLLRTTTTYKQALERHASQKDRPPDFETTEFTTFANIILDALHFRTIASRRDAIPQAHKATFQWIYRDPEAHDKPWDNFSDWLKSGAGCYWINGKAGSGKSTLMKFLQEDPRTERALKEWAGSSELVIASFFFWYAGTPLQKSQEGLLRSLLLDVLNKRPELIPILFPDVCRSIIAKQLENGIELTYRIAKGFYDLCKTCSSRLESILYD